ncbi:MAG: tRNA uridine-5-carboxymethylaminomethyl(34) synthesis GTPase MnmE [Oscillospiraceae bacterium]
MDSITEDSDILSNENKINTEEKTIAAIATAFGQGSISVVRISGKDSKKIASKIFKGKQNIEALGDYQGCYGKIYDTSKKPEIYIDEVILLNFNCPKSYTGEDIIEISCHGGVFVTKKLLDAVLNAGAVLAQPGEFTKRAFLNGKISLTQAEGVMDLISAHSKQSFNIANELKKGNLYKKISYIIENLITLSGHFTAWIDFPEEDVAQITEDEIKNVITTALYDLENLINSFDKGQIIKNGIKTAICGKPNVGKSTLMNALTGYEKSIVTDIPGTTRDVIEEQINLRDFTLLISDTAGVRLTTDKVEAQGVKIAKEKIEASQLILGVFDISRELDQDDLNILSLAKDKPFIAIINKNDLETKLDVNIINEYTNSIVYISAKSLFGMETLEQEIERILNLENIDTKAPLIANERQKRCAIEAKDNLKESLFAINNKMTFDAIAVCVENATENLMELTGKNTNEEIINEVFSKFCVGK